jgi:hypothetical protein
MKTIRIILLALIVVGLGLLLTQRFWVPSLVTMILEQEKTVEVPAPEITTTAPILPAAEMANWNWVTSDVSAQGMQFMYPEPLPTEFVTVADWPPAVSLVAGEFVCAGVDTATANGAANSSTILRVIGQSEYCVSVAYEGAAGSTYTTYQYVTKQGDFLEQVSFTLRTPQCLNYDEPKQSTCKLEQANFAVDALAERIVASMTMP